MLPNCPVGIWDAQLAPGVDRVHEDGCAVGVHQGEDLVTGSLGVRAPLEDEGHRRITRQLSVLECQSI